MKTTRILSLITSIFGLLTPLLLSSCAADPELQKQMDRDISAASNTQKVETNTGNQQGQRSTEHEQGGF